MLCCVCVSTYLQEHFIAFVRETRLLYFLLYKISTTQIVFCLLLKICYFVEFNYVYFIQASISLMVLIYIIIIWVWCKTAVNNILTRLLTEMMAIWV